MRDRFNAYLCQIFVLKRALPKTCLQKCAIMLEEKTLRYTKVCYFPPLFFITYIITNDNYISTAGFEGDVQPCHQRLNTSSVESNTPEQNYVEDSWETTGDIDPHFSGDGHQISQSCKNEVEIHTHPPQKRTPMRLISELARYHKVSIYFTNTHYN